MTRKQTVLFLAAWCFFSSAALALAGDPPLAAFPKDADVVIRLKAPQKTIEKVAVTAGAADEKLAAQIQENAPFIGVLISNPALAGVDMEQDWLVVVHAHADSDPAVVFCIPATDASAMQAALDPKFQKFDRDGWVYYSEDAAAIESLQKTTPSTGDAITSEIDGPAKALFDQGDISVFLNADHLTEVYKDQLEKGTSDAVKQLNRQAGMLSVIPGVDMGSAFGEGANTGREILKDTRAFTSATVFTENGVNIETLGQFKDGSTTAQAIDGHPGDSLATVSQLPAGGVLYFGVSSSLSQKVETGLSSAGALDDEEPTEEKQAKVEKLKKTLAEVTFKSFAVGLGIGHLEDGILRLTSITEASPTSKVRDFKEATSELSNVELPGQGIKQTSEYTRDAETAGDQKIDLQVVETTVDPNVNPFMGKILTDITTALFGPKGMQARYSYWDDKYLFGMGGGPEAMKTAVEGVAGSQPNGTDEFREKLLPQPNVLVLLDVRQIGYRLLKAAAARPELNLPIDPQSISEKAPAPSYIGFSASTEPKALRTKSQLPSEQLKAIVELAIVARSLRQQQRNR
jgi:hypothetical protein